MLPVPLPQAASGSTLPFVIWLTSFRLPTCPSSWPRSSERNGQPSFGWRWADSRLPAGPSPS
jgi:hypothetical protein